MEFETGLFGTEEVFCFVFFLFPPLKLGSDCPTGVTDWTFGIPRELGEGEIRKTCCSSKKKKNIDGLELS